MATTAPTTTAPRRAKRRRGPGPRRATGLVNPTGLVGLQAPETSLPKPSAATLGDIERKVYAGERLSADDGLALYACDDLPWLGQWPALSNAGSQAITCTSTSIATST